MRKKTISLFLLLYWMGSCQAQDPRFSQFFVSPLTLNPALTGNFNGSLRVAGNMRFQNPDFDRAYTTQTLSIDFPILAQRIPYTDRLSVGALMVADQRGNKLFSTHQLGLSIAYLKGFDAEQKRSLAAGFQFNMGNTRFNQNRAQWEDQLTAGGFTGVSNDMVLANGLGKNFQDLNAGILYQYAPTEDQVFYIGASLYQILGANKLIQASASPGLRRLSLNGGLSLPVGRAGTLHSSFHAQVQQKNAEMVLGGAYSQLIEHPKWKDLSLYVGLWLRTDQSIIPYLGLEWSSMRLGISQDFGFSKTLTGANFRPSHEISLVYVLNKDKSLVRYRCAKF